MTRRSVRQSAGRMIYNKFDSFRWQYFTVADSPTTRGREASVLDRSLGGEFIMLRVARGLSLSCPEPDTCLLCLDPALFDARLVPAMAIQDTPHPYLSLCSSCHLHGCNLAGCSVKLQIIHLYISGCKRSVLTLIAAIAGWALRTTKCFMPWAGS